MRTIFGANGLRASGVLLVAAVLGGCAGLPGGAGGTTPPAAGGVLDMCSLATLEEVSGWLQRDAQVWDELTAEDRRTFCTWYGDPEGADNEFEMVAEVGLWTADANDYVTVAGAEEFWGGAGQRLTVAGRPAYFAAPAGEELLVELDSGRALYFTLLAPGRGTDDESDWMRRSIEFAETVTSRFLQ